MSFFTPEQLSIIESTTVRAAFLVDLLFNEPSRFWNGDHSLEIDGKLYGGAGQLGRIEGLEEQRSTESAQVTLTLSGTDAETNRIAMMNTEDQEGSLCFISLQLFDPDWQRVGAPIVKFVGITQPLIATRQSSEEGTGAQRSLTLPVENFFYSRSRPRASLYTSTDQRARFPGDAFLDFQYRMLRGVSYTFP